VITSAIESGEIRLRHLHWYFVNPLNWSSVQAATKHDMGVIIISARTTKAACCRTGRPGWRSCARRCRRCSSTTSIALRGPKVHTLSCWRGAPTDFDEHIAALEF